MKTPDFLISEMILAVALIAVTGCQQATEAPAVPKSRAPAIFGTAPDENPFARRVVPDEKSSSQSNPLAPHEDLDATLWMRSSAEYHILATDTYRRALAAVNIGVADPKWSAIPLQSSALADETSIDESFPTAVILDVDETVLDNSQFQIECIHNEPFQFSVEKWNAWCERAQATPIPGVQEFIDGCRQRGVAVRYVTNRDRGVREATIKNLRKYGLVPPGEAADVELLCKNDQPEWGSDKTNRREFVASQFRVLVLIGDDLNDFVFSGDKAAPADRIVVAKESLSLWGSRWFLLPNANYGGWEKAVQGYVFPAERPEYIRMKIESLGGVPAGSVPAEELNDGTNPGK